MLAISLVIMCLGALALGHVIRKLIALVRASTILSSLSWSTRASSSARRGRWPCARKGQSFRLAGARERDGEHRIVFTRPIGGKMTGYILGITMSGCALITSFVFTIPSPAGAV